MGDPVPLDLDFRRLLTLVRRLHRLKQIGVIAFFDTQDGVQIVLDQFLDMRGIRTQGVFGYDKGK